MVRGGTFSQLVLDKETVSFIKKMILSATDKCFNCGVAGHFVKNCPNTNTNTNTNTIPLQSEPIKVIPTEIKAEIKKELPQTIEIICSRCGRNTHQASACYAKTNIKGEDITGSFPYGKGELKN